MDYIGKEKHVVVDFYKSNCPYCKILAPEYKKFWEYAQNNPELNLIVAKFNTDSYKKIKTKYGIDSYPTVLYFPPYSTKIFSEFRDQREFDNLRNWFQ